MGKIYKTDFVTEAVEFLSKYDVDYIMITQKVFEDYGVKELNYAESIKCLKLVYTSEDKENIKIYETECRLA